MNLDVNSRFSYNPGVSAPRSRFDLSTKVKTSFNVGELVPFYLEEVLPGDTFDIYTSCLVRMQTLLTPILDDLYLDFFYFFVPNRILWDHWKDFMGENTKGPWYPKTEYTVPQINVAPGKAVAPKSLADYLGIPPVTTEQGSTGFSFNALPFRAYGLIWNEWFRDQNLQDPVLIDKGDATRQYNADIAVDGGKLLLANKYHDYFTSALPSPQKGEDVTIPLASVAPVYSVDRSAYPDVNWSYPSKGLEFRANSPTASTGFFAFGTEVPSGGLKVGDYISTKLKNTGGSGNANVEVVPSNLVADLNSVPVSTINSLRLAFATQRLLEKDARGGTRYREIIKSHFNTESPDARQQVPELLSYNRVYININQVVQQSETANTPQGHTAAYSLTADEDNSFIKSFTEHGFVMGLCCARYKHTYQQGLNRMFSRKTRFDYYWPVFANLGEQPILNKEIYLQGKDKDSEVFGYQEAWAEYRYHPDTCTGEMRSTYPESLDVWHLGDNYNSLPSLSPGWIAEDKVPVDRALAVNSSVSNQIFGDFYIDSKATRVMPMFSIPGMSEKL